MNKEICNTCDHSKRKHNKKGCQARTKGKKECLCKEFEVKQ